MKSRSLYESVDLNVPITEEIETARASLSVRERGLKLLLLPSLGRWVICRSLYESVDLNTPTAVGEESTFCRSLYESVDLNKETRRIDDLSTTSLSVRERGFKQEQPGNNGGNEGRSLYESVDLNLG